MKLLEMLESADEWTSMLKPTEAALYSVACYPLYATLVGPNLRAGTSPMSQSSVVGTNPAWSRPGCKRFGSTNLSMSVTPSASRNTGTGGCISTSRWLALWDPQILGDDIHLLRQISDGDCIGQMPSRSIRSVLRDQDGVGRGGPYALFRIRCRSHYFGPVVDPRVASRRLGDGSPRPALVMNAYIPSPFLTLDATCDRPHPHCASEPDFLVIFFNIGLRIEGSHAQCLVF
jgi:hypothetical protein